MIVFLNRKDITDGRWNRHKVGYRILPDNQDVLGHRDGCDTEVRSADRCWRRLRVASRAYRFDAAAGRAEIAAHVEAEYWPTFTLEQLDRARKTIEYFRKPSLCFCQ